MRVALILLMLLATPLVALAPLPAQASGALCPAGILCAVPPAHR